MIVSSMAAVNSYAWSTLHRHVHTPPHISATYQCAALTTTVSHKPRPSTAAMTHTTSTKMSGMPVKSADNLIIYILFLLFHFISFHWAPSLVGWMAWWLFTCSLPPTPSHVAYDVDAIMRYNSFALSSPTTDYYQLHACFMFAPDDGAN